MAKSWMATSLLAVLGVLSISMVAAAWAAGGWAEPVVLSVTAVFGNVCAWFAARLVRRSGASDRLRWGVVVCGVLALRIVGLTLPANSDVDRYLWEGRIQWHGFNPYRFAPNDPALDGFDDEHRREIRHPEKTAIYGPLTLLVSAAVARLWYSEWAFKILFTFLDLALIALVAMLGRDQNEKLAATTAYGWSSLPALLTAGSGHNEVLWVLSLILGLCFLTHGRMTAAALALGGALAFKPTALVAVLFVLPTIPCRFWLWLLPIPCVGLLLYADAGLGLWRSLITFSAEYEYNDLWPFAATQVLGWVAPHEFAALAARISSGLILLLLLVRTWRAEKADPWDRALLGMGAFLLLSPIVHPWYGLSVLVLASRRLGSVWWWLVFGLGFYFLNYLEMNRLDQWTETPWVRALVFGPILLAWIAVHSGQARRAK